MNNLNETPTIENRYEIQDLHIINTKNGKPIYIREILDVGSYEFESSHISAEKRLDIIANLGLNSLINVLKECHKINGRSDSSASFDGFFALSILLNEIYPNFCFQLDLPSKNPNFALRLTALK